MSNYAQSLTLRITQKLHNIVKDLYVLNLLIPAEVTTGGNLVSYIDDQFSDPKYANQAVDIIERHITNWKMLDPTWNQSELDNECLAYLCVCTLDQSTHTKQIVQSVIDHINTDPYTTPLFVDLVDIKHIPIDLVDPDDCQPTQGVTLTIEHPFNPAGQVKIGTNTPHISRLLEDKRSWLNKHLFE